MTSTEKRNATPPDNGHRFQKGQSGNPGGLRPWQAEMKKLMREHTADAVAVVVNIMQNGKSEKDRLSAAQYIIDQTCGKAIQKISAESDEGVPLAGLMVSFVSPNSTNTGQA